MDEKTLLQAQLKAWTTAREVLLKKVEAYSANAAFSGEVASLLVGALATACENEQRLFYAVQNLGE